MGENMLLTRDERARFVSWLKQQVATDEALVAQMEKVRMPVALINRHRQHALACSVIAYDLEAVEEVTIRG